MLVRNGAKTYVKNPQVLHREKIRETGFMKSSSHSSTESGSVYYVTAGKGIEARDFSTFTFPHWANKLSFLIERHSKLRSEIKNVLFFTPLRTGDETVFLLHGFYKKR
jgi:hypothetical protein